MKSNHEIFVLKIQDLIVYLCRKKSIFLLCELTEQKSVFI